MFRNYFKIAFRSLWKNRLFTLINLLGLSLGLGSAFVMILFIQRGLTFDTFYDDSDQIYYVQTEDKDGAYNQTVFPILDQLLKTYPEMETGTHVQGWNNVWINYKGKDIQKNTKYVDPDFFNVLSFRLKYGNPKTALKNKESIILSAPVAIALFGNRNPVGETLMVRDTLAFTVTGVLAEIPSNTSVQFEILMPVANLESDPGFVQNADWFNSFATVYLKLKKGADVRKLEAQFPDFVKTHFTPAGSSRKIHLVPIRDYIHYQNPAFKNMIYGVATAVVFILLIISINLINLNTAVSFTRAKEVAVRKVTGSTLRQILTQFWIESGIVLLVSLFVSACFAVMYLVPKFNELRKERMQLVIDWQQDYPTILTLLTIITVIALVAGTYPALYLNKLDLRDTIKGKLSGKPDTGGWRQGSLVVTQFVLSFFLVTGAICVRSQVSFMRSADLGVDKEHVVVVQSDLEFKDPDAAVNQFSGILEDFKQDSRIRSLSTSGVVVTKYWTNYGKYYPEGENTREVRFKQASTGARYAETFGIRMLEGRDFNDELDQNSTENPVVINETAMKAMGLKTAVGKQLRKKNNPKVFKIVGVMKDFNYQDLKEKIEPLLHWYEGKAALNSYLSMNFTNIEQAQSVLAGLEMKMKTMPAKKPFTYFYLSDEVSRQYNHLDGVWTLINFVTMLSIVIALAGIFGLITLAANQRTKEVGIRKVMGAGIQQIVVLLSKDFVKLVLIAILIAMPLAYPVANRYLESFQYHVRLEWYVFAFTGLSALIITVLTVGYQSIRAALMDPVQSLRNE